MKKTRQNIKKIIIFLILIALIFTLNFTVFPKNIKNFFFLISSPVQKTFWQAGVNVSDFFSGIFKASDIIEEMVNLKLKNQEFISQIIFLKELKKENEFLKKSLELDLEKDFQLIFVQVTSKDISQDSILINKGKKDGISENLPVITGQKVLLGRVGQVYDNFSEVVLITNKKSSFDVKIVVEEIMEEVREEIYGIARGRGNFKIYLELIPKNKEIFENDIIVSSVLGGIYPSGLLVGKIKAIEKSDLEPFQEAELEPTFDIKRLDYLFVIKEF